MEPKKVIPINVAPPASPAAAAERQERLERAGFMRMMVIGEPRLSELVAKYRARGYEVEVVPYMDDAPVASAGGCGSSCGSGGASRSTGSCSSGGGCGSASSPISVGAAAPIPADMSTIYLRIGA